MSAIFDYNPKISAAMKPEYWEKCMPSVEHLLQMVEENQGELTTGKFYKISDPADLGVKMFENWVSNFFFSFGKEFACQTEKKLPIFYYYY